MDPKEQESFEDYTAEFTQNQAATGKKWKLENY